ncbi:hypothetical protein [Novosphingobium soli]|uniref:Uncharacterized protein n=1 Tax=Novosphingobium soli TaxID=574956 RepID=A0ABV6CQZ5_9SPHN
MTDTSKPATGAVAGRAVTGRSLVNTLLFGKPDPTPQERRNYLRWGHNAPTAEHKLIVIALAAVAALLTILAFAGPALGQPAGPRGTALEAAAGQHGARIVLLAPLA